MKRIIPLLTALIIGFGLGYYLGYIKPGMKLYRQMKSKTGLSDEEMMQLVKQSKEVMKEIEGVEESTALVSLAATLKIDAGDCQGAAQLLAMNIGTYYRTVGPPAPGMSKTRRALLERIQVEATNHPVIARAIEAKPAN